MLNTDVHFTDWWSCAPESSHWDFQLRKEVRLAAELSELLNVSFAIRANVMSLTSCAVLVVAHREHGKDLSEENFLSSSFTRPLAVTCQTRKMGINGVPS